MNISNYVSISESDAKPVFNIEFNAINVALNSVDENGDQVVNPQILKTYAIYIMSTGHGVGTAVSMDKTLNSSDELGDSIYVEQNLKIEDAINEMVDITINSTTAVIKD